MSDDEKRSEQVTRMVDAKVEALSLSRKVTQIQNMMNEKNATVATVTDELRKNVGSNIRNRLYRCTGPDYDGYTVTVQWRSEKERPVVTIFDRQGAEV